MRKLARAFQALSDPNRIRILKMLEVRPLCVCEIRAVLGLATSTVSKHLSVLRDAGFVTDEKDGKWVSYSLAGSSADPAVKELLPVMARLLPDDHTIRKDAEMARAIDRESVCA